MRGARARTIITAITVVAAAAGAHAQSAPQSVDLTVMGSVERICVLASPQVNVGGSTNIGQVAGSTVVIADLSDADTMTTKAADFTAEFSGMCNFRHQITVSSDRGGLWREPAGAPAAGFANGVPYRATVDWGGSEATLLAGATGESQVQQQMTIDLPALGSVALHFHIDQSATNAGSGVPLVAGTYDDTIRVTLGPL